MVKLRSRSPKKKSGGLMKSEQKFAVTVYKDVWGDWSSGGKVACLPIRKSVARSLTPSVHVPGKPWPRY